jgi:FtsH-binding integral membrane protein
MENLWLIFFWSGPIGLGIGLALICVFVLLLAKDDEIIKRTKAFKKEKGL